MNNWIKVFAPATVANIGPGFDIMGFALNHPGDIVWARSIPGTPGVVIKEILNDEGYLPKEAEKNTAGVAAIEVVKKTNYKQRIELIVEKQMPISSGLGSSSASAAAAVYAANLLTGEKLSKDELIEIAGMAEHTITTNYGENCIAALLGGFVITTNFQPLQGRRIGYLEDLWAIVVHPHMRLETKKAREILPPLVPLTDAVKNNQNTTRMVAGIIHQDIDLFLAGVDDLIIEKARKHLIPGFDDVKQAALAAGAPCATISGAGPSLFAFAKTKSAAEKIGNAMQQAFKKNNLSSTIYISEINPQGTYQIQ